MKLIASIFPLFFTPLLLPAQSDNKVLNQELLKGFHIRNIGPAAMSGRITAITVDPNRPEVIYAGAASGGVWRSESSGTDWEPIFDKAPTQSVGSIAINPKNPDEIWVGTGEGNPRNSQNFGIGIFKSINGGRDWKCMGLQNSRSIHRILINPQNPAVVYAASMGSSYGPNPDRGVFKSADGGKTWSKVLYVNDLTGCSELVMDPQNPNKLIASMWEYQRWPWFFKSGGKGSGLYISYDGGENWERKTDKDGLPEGELGRIGLAIARSNPAIVYALVEAKENALYRSTDGGKSWNKTTSRGMGDRPFYYSEIYVDPGNPDAVYSIFTTISKSEDGGKNFETWAGWNIHPDHHSFWIHPDNPDYIIEGNDGGLNITLDRGKTWRFAANIPVGQFYHVETDDEWPYNVYGGLQDNGSWVGPSAVWKPGGIRNLDWQEITFGDGFEIIPQKDNPRYIFSQSQGGEVSLNDRVTGDSRFIKPLHPDGKTKLRFNWNTALAQDPFQPHGIYIGSQFVHYSDDLGQNWRIISPDLTTGDTSKMHQDISGGLTTDATNAENYCTIIAINPSPVQQGLVWAGTDDGNVQMTRDGGKTWENFADKLPGAPKNGWIPAMEASPVNAGEAFVVVNNYRQNDWQPYLYQTTDYGRKWKRLVSPKNLPAATGAEGGNYCLSIVQDPVEPDLLFLGTDEGLYVSIDHGERWTKWPEESLPSVPVFDMKIQQRDGDLVLGTFGRALWILDNLAPLRALAHTQGKLMDESFRLINAQPGILAEFRSFNGPRFGVNETFKGDNKWNGVRIPVWVKPGAIKPAKKDTKKEEADDSKPRNGRGRGKNGSSKKEKAIVVITSMQGDTLRQFKSELDTAFTSSIFWGMDTKGVRFPSKNEPQPDDGEPGGGPQVLPGSYWVKVKYGEWNDSVLVKVIDDPRLKIAATDRSARNEAVRNLYKTVERATKAYNRLKEAEKTIGRVEEQFVNVPDSLKKETMKLGAALKDSIANYKNLFFNHKETKGIQLSDDDLNSLLFNALGYINGNMGAPNSTTRIAIDKANKSTEEVVARINTLFDKQWTEYRNKVETIRYSLFKDWERL